MHVLQNTDITTAILARLILAAFLGGIIGLEREIRRKSAGLRTNMFICIGSALFTLLSDQLATKYGSGDHTRIAAQIISGIGFLGAGAIIRERGTVVGLTTAATIFSVASIGMAVGGGLYVTAVFACLLILVLLVAVGWLEDVFSLKTRQMVFRVTAQNLEATMSSANAAFVEAGVTVQHFQVLHIGQDFLLEFEADVSVRQQNRLAVKITPLGTKFEIVSREYVAA
ncbi:MAG TPA: MgtC/SapB family protein [Candidatus Acidoferrum sp.]|nr:MgtC/SapB family protein [Candidatus Acidoferrum sp.]